MLDRYRALEKTVTDVPIGTWVPEGGSVRVTLPCGTEFDASLIWPPTTSWSWLSLAPAVVGSVPTSDGMATCFLPVETTNCTADPLARLAFGAGLVLSGLSRGRKKSSKKKSN